MDFSSKFQLSEARCFMSVFFFLSLLPANVISVGNYQLTILHTSDFRSRYNQVDAGGAECTREQVERGECFGGITRLAGQIEAIRAEGGNVLLLDGGNQFEATPWFAAYREKASVHFMNLTKYDAMAIGYREFDLTPSGIADYIQQLPFPALSSNIDASNEPDLKSALTGSTVLNVGGENIGIVGYTYGNAATNTKIGDVKFTDAMNSITKEVEKLQRRAINKILVLGTSTLSMSKSLAARIPGVDIVVGGGTRTFLYNGDPPSTNPVSGPYPEVILAGRGRNALVAQTVGFGKYLGRLDVTFDMMGHLKDWTGNPILLDKTSPEDPETKAQFVEWEHAFRGDQLHLGKSHVHIDGARRSCRLMECPLGNVVTDAMVMASITPSSDRRKWTDAAIALINSGSMRASMPIGNIFTDDMGRILPYESTVDMMSLRGQHIIEALEHAVANYDMDRLHGRFLQVSGLRVVYDLSKSKGERVVRLYVLCAECLVPRYVPLDVDEVYKILVSSFIANGGDGFKMIRDNRIDYTPGLSTRDAVRVYVKEHSPLVIPLEGRIRFLSHDKEGAKPNGPNGNGGRPNRPILNVIRGNGDNMCTDMDNADVYPPSVVGKM